MTLDGGILTVEPASHVDDDAWFLDVPVELAVIDLAGTALQDTWLVEGAFTAACEHIGVVQSDDDLDRMMAFVRETMGQPTIDVLRALAGAEDIAQRALATFDAAYRDKVGAVVPTAGAEHAFELLRDSGVSIALTSNFSRQTTDAVIVELGWRDVSDVTLCPADVRRGHPFPDLPLAALVRAGAASVDSMIVVGDTVSDVHAGNAAGAGLIAGLLSGAHGAEQLHEAGADEILGSLAMLPAMLGVSTES